ncbi:MAG: discoidin domain-containing protein [Ruminococcaceae bacterium]|nr:discoidin domain-containing protein [Oscillospiraceae bacterium]
MKKTLATLLVVALVASVCGMMFVSAEETNLALGKEVLNAGKRDGYYADLTDGVALDSLTYNATDWFGFYWNPGMDLAGNEAQKTNAIDGIAKPTVDLGEVASIGKVRLNLFDGCTSGITTPETVTLKVSTDGETYTDVDVKSFEWPADGSSNVIWVEFALETPVDARYVCLEMKMRTTFVFINEIEVYAPAAEGGNEPVEPAAPEMFWLTHYADGTVEGSGVIYTEEDTAGDWWIHVAFAPIAGADNAYEIVEITNGLSDGSAAKVAVPEGGFVWASNYGNNYPAIGGYGDDAIDYTSPNCTDAINRATAWKVGDKFVISGVDFETIPTSTPDVKWYDDAYVCTATIAPYVPGSTVKPVVPAVKETITVDGKLDDNAYKSAVWFNDGIWQSANGATLEDLDVAYTVRSDDDNIYLTIKVNQGVDFATALNPDAWDQSGATNFRIWLMGDGMSERVFYDLLWDGEEFVPFLKKKPTDHLTYEAGIGDDYINMEIAIAKSDLSITDSFKLMVTYSTPNCLNADGTNAYNAFHITACDEMPSGWSSNTDAYETYNCADIALGNAPGDESILVFAVLGLLAIAGAAVTIKSKI